MPPKTLRNCHVLTIDVLQIWPFHPQPTTTPLALTGWQIVDQQLLHGLTRPGQPRGRDESSNTNDLYGSSIWFSMMFQDVPRYSYGFPGFSYGFQGCYYDFPGTSWAKPHLQRLWTSWWPGLWDFSHDSSGTTGTASALFAWLFDFLWLIKSYNLVI